MGEFFLTIEPNVRLAAVFLLPIILTFVLIGFFTALSRRLIRILDAISSGALRIAIILACVMVLAQLLVIIGRYVFDWSASWANEIIIYSFAALFLLAAPSALKTDAHVRVDIFRETMSAKQKAGIDLAGLFLFLFPICALILWAAISRSSIQSWVQFEGSRESDGLPIYFLFRTLVPLFAVLLMSQGLSEALKAGLILSGKTPDEPLEQQPTPEGI